MWLSNRRRGAAAAALLIAASVLPAGAQPAPEAVASGGMPAPIAAELRRLGPVIDPRAVGALYAPALAAQPTDGVQRTNDVAYGPDPRHRLDLFRPAGPEAPRAVAIFLHGGGFVRGDKGDRANVGYLLARSGIVALLPNYRLAPAAPWPAGAEDAARVAAWANGQAAAWGVAPDRVVLMGESAGAAHAAAAALTGAAGGAAPRLAGLVLLSGVYDVDLENRAKAAFGLPSPDPRNDAYFGTDASTFRAKSTLHNLVAPAFPVLIGYAALDPPQMQVQSGELFGALCRLGPCPQLRWFADHDHISPASSFNTPDLSVSGPVLDFIAAARRH